METLTMVPAVYTGDFTSAEDAAAAWNAGKDFRIMDISAGRDDGRYINKADMREYLPFTFARIRFNKQQDVVLVRPDGTIFTG